MTTEGRIELRYRPLGVVGIITPWNVPVGIAIGRIIQALYTGNTVVQKPSPYTPLATLRMGETVAQGPAPRRPEHPRRWKRASVPG